MKKKVRVSFGENDIRCVSPLPGIKSRLGTFKTGAERYSREKMLLILYIRVADPDPPGSGQFGRIRIRRNYFNMDPAPVAKATQIMRKSNFFSKNIAFINLQTKPNLSKHVYEAKRI